MIHVKEATVAELAGTRVGCGNVWERTYLLPDGTKRRGLTAQLFVRGGNRLIVGAGSEFRLPTGRWRVRSVDRAHEGYGVVTLERVE